MLILNYSKPIFILLIIYSVKFIHLIMEIIITIIITIMHIIFVTRNIMNPKINSYHLIFVIN